MDIEIASIQGQGDATKEVVILRVINDCPMQYYSLVDTTYIGSGVSNKARHFYWFPLFDAKKGDYVALWTGLGQDRVEISNGIRWIQRYWGLRTPIWNNAEDAAVLFQYQTWKTTKSRPI